MLSDKVGYDINSECEDNNYKSCFARSVVNSQHQQEKHLTRQLQNQGLTISKGDTLAAGTPLFVSKENLLTKTSKAFFSTDRNPSISSWDSRRSSACSSRIAEMPVENLLLKSQIETLQWQLKQTESSKEMYREVMVQVVKFLERAYHSLQLLGSKVSPNRQIVPRASQILNMDIQRVSVPAIETHCDYHAFRDFTCRRQKKTETFTEEVSPEKLSQEAFRLLRTAQSLLNTHSPDLAQLNNDASEDINFLEQLAKEFPRVQENGTQRPDSCCSSSLQIDTPDKDVLISTAFNRKLALRQNTKKRNSFDLTMLPSSNYTEDGRGSINSHKYWTLNNRNKNRKFKHELENSSATVSSVSSVEDESGFSSMNSFQEIGIPLINSTVAEEETQEEQNIPSCTNNSDLLTSKDFELWKTPKHEKLTTNHKKWNSTPSEITEKPLKVLWV